MWPRRSENVVIAISGGKFVCAYNFFLLECCLKTKVFDDKISYYFIEKKIMDDWVMKILKSVLVDNVQPDLQILDVHLRAIQEIYVERLKWRHILKEVSRQSGFSHG